MKSTQDKFRLVNDGKMLKKDFLTEVKRTHSNLITQTTTYKDAVQILKNKNIVNEHFLGLQTTKPLNSNPDWFKIFRENVVEEDVKAELKKTDKDVVELETKGYDYKDPKNIDNLYGESFLQGYYTELKNPKNADKTEVELKEIVAKNLESNRLYYTEEAQFGIEGIGYTDDAPGLAPSKSDQMVPVKESHIKLSDLLNEEWVNYGGEGAEVNEADDEFGPELGAVEDEYGDDAAVEAEEMEQEGTDVTETPKPAKKLSLEARLREIENLGRSIALEAKIQAVSEEITNRMDKLNVAENMEEVADFINPVRIKETRKEIKLLEKKKKMYEKLYKKLTKEEYKAPIVDEELNEELVSDVEEIKKKGKSVEGVLQNVYKLQTKVVNGEPGDNLKNVVRKDPRMALIGFEDDRLYIFVNLEKKDVLNKIADAVLDDGTNDIQEYNQIASLLHYVEA